MEGSEGAGNAVDLLVLSDRLGVPHLFEYAQLWIANQQDLSDCADTLALAERHRAGLLEQASLSLMAANIETPEVDQQLSQLSNEHRNKLQEMAQKLRRS